MADDARISTALPRHPKTVKLQRRLGAPGCWSLICLFLWIAENRPTGDLEGMSGEDIEIAATWPAESGDFVRTLVEVRFLDGQEGAYKLHDWAEHNPWVATRPQRTEAAKKAAAIRWEKMRGASDRNAETCEPHETAMPSSPLHSTLPDTTEPKSPLLENPSIHSKEKRFSQADFDEEAYRLFAKAGRELDLKIANGLEVSPEEAFKYQSAKAGKSPQRMSEILARVEGGGRVTHCRQPGCKLTQWSNRGFCYGHEKQARGFVFDSERGLFVKAGAVRADTQRSATPLQESGSVFPRIQERADVGLA